MNRAFNVLLLLLTFTPLTMGIDLPDSLKPFYEKQGVAFGGLTGSDEGDEGIRFVDFIKANWEAVAKEFDTFAPNPRQQSLVALAAEQLNPRTYLSFVTLICDKIAAKQVAPDIIETFLLSEGPKKGFFAFNYDAPEVRSIIARFKQLVPGSKSDVRGLLDGIESGKARDTLLMWQKVEGGSGPELLERRENGQAPANTTAPPTTPVPPSTPNASPAPTAPVAQTPVAVVERKSSAWPWLVGILALVVIVAVALKRRA